MAQKLRTIFSFAELEFTSTAHRVLGGVTVGHKLGHVLVAQLGGYVEDGRQPGTQSIDEGDPDIQ